MPEVPVKSQIQLRSLPEIMKCRPPQFQVRGDVTISAVALVAAWITDPQPLDPKP